MVVPELVWGLNDLKRRSNVSFGDDTLQDSNLPSWLCNHEAVTLHINNTYVQGELTQDHEGYWQFVSRNIYESNQRLIVDIPDLQSTYRERVCENSLVSGWSPNPGSGQSSSARFVSAKRLDNVLVPSTLCQLARLSPQDRQTWMDAYMEEYHSLRKIGVFDEITAEEYRQYQRQS